MMVSSMIPLVEGRSESVFPSKLSCAAHHSGDPMLEASPCSHRRSPWPR